MMIAVLDRRPPRPHAPRAVLAAGLAAALAASPALARQTSGQDTLRQSADTVRLRDIVVSATRLPAARAAVPAAVTVITGEELRLRGIRLIGDALRTVPGAALAQSGSAGGITALFLRGGESDYVQVLIDGVHVNEPGGAFDFAHLPVHDVERIEVVRGPASVLYGTDAVAGVVHIITRDGGGPLRVEASVEGGRGPRLGADAAGAPAGGRHGVAAFDAAAHGATGPLRYSFGAARYAHDGLRAVNNEYANRSLSGRLAWRAARPGVAARSDAALTTRWSDHVYHYPTDGAGRIVDLNQFSSGRALALSFDGGHHVTPALEARVLLALHRSETGFDDRPDGPADTLGSFAAVSRARGSRRSADVRANLLLPRATVLTLGAAVAAQHGRSAYESWSEWGPFTSAAAHARSSRAAYVQVVTAPAASLTVTLGARAEHSRTFGRFDTWRAGANYRLLPGTTLRVAAGTAFKEPTFYENFADGYVTGNPDLLPERSRNHELGLEQRLGTGARLGLTAFRQRFADMIQYDARPREQRPGDANYFNLAGASAAGLEVELGMRLRARAELVASYTFLQTEVTDAGAGADRALRQGERLLRRPAHTAHLGVRGSLSERITGAITARYIGARADLDFAGDWQGERVTLPAAAVFDANARWTVLQGHARSPDLALSVRAENLLDRRYEEIRNFPMRGRTLFVGLSAAATR